MQFKRVSKRVQVLAYRGYDNEKRRAVVKMVGSFDAYTYEIPAELLESLSDGEKTELHNYIDGLKRLSSKQYEDMLVCRFSRDVVKIAGLILDEDRTLDQQWGDEAWLAMNKLQKALKKLGFNRPSKQATIKQEFQEDTQQAGLDFGSDVAQGFRRANGYSGLS